MSFDMNKKNINDYINTELNKFKFNRTSLGYKYLKIAISNGIQDELLIEDLNNRLYKKMENELKVEKKKINGKTENLLTNVIPASEVENFDVTVYHEACIATTEHRNTEGNLPLNVEAVQEAFTKATTNKRDSSKRRIDGNS